MCWCKPEVKTPNCGSMQCLGAAIKAERKRIITLAREKAVHHENVADKKHNNHDAHISYGLAQAFRNFACELEEE